jgi:transposase-like protein
VCLDLAISMVLPRRWRRSLGHNQRVKKYKGAVSLEASGNKKTKKTGKAAGQSRSDIKDVKHVRIADAPTIVSDKIVADALADLLQKDFETIDSLMRTWRKQILKAMIPGKPGHMPTKAMMDAAKRDVLRFYAKEEALGDESAVAKAFRFVTGEQNLRIDWGSAKARVHKARLDRRQKIDKWNECLAMQSGASNSTTEIWICGTRRLTLRALTSLICHEGLHNMARRTRRGNSFLSEDLEHMAMALLGDPQLVHGD